jgi:hypothetical protein
MRPVAALDGCAGLIVRGAAVTARPATARPVARMRRIDNVDAEEARRLASRATGRRTRSRSPSWYSLILPERRIDRRSRFASERWEKLTRAAEIAAKRLRLVGFG